MDEALNFNNEKREINCRTINTVILFVKKHGKSVEELIKDVAFDEKYLTDTNNWISHEVQSQIFSKVKEMFANDQILYDIGLASEELHSLGFIDYIVRLMKDPHFIIKQAPALNKYFNKSEEIQVVKYGPGGAVVRYYSKSSYKINADDCNYTRGTLAALPRIWGVGPAKIREETCSVPIDKKGKIKGKLYRVDKSGRVYEYVKDEEKSQISQEKIIGRLKSDETFELGGTVYGAKYCTYHIFWSALKMFSKGIIYELFTKPKVLEQTIYEMMRENDIILQKYEELYEKNLTLQQYYVDVINALIRAIDAKDHYTEDHSLKVAVIAESIARELKLSRKKIAAIRKACKLHDLGKIGIKETILLKPSKLTEEEWQEIKKHPILGAEIIKPLTFLSDVAVLIRQDHERWDGQGYPDGLRGEEIDIGARVILVADTYDAMTSGRPYRKPLKKEQAVEEIKNNSGRQFDPKVVEAFLQIISKIPSES
ncbi:MAG: HD-GYP domain-containing protein [Candidatus Omnitrophica bacterium]|nr:HD-GYP domain-containing protein [Candidatus Omnitrophota bacterium]